MKLIKLEQPSCTPCQLVSNYLNEKGIEYEVIDVTEQPEVAAEYGVMGVPVTILLDGEGNEVKRSIGFKPDELDELIKNLKE
ncbi:MULTISPECIES: glutaredoxin family protein [Bacillus]|uniref:SPBc2 prophage-derived thioredoxin-like protein YosR n=1 Tax=Bacillus sonorensis TaxID=119858 RepID=A0ABN5AIM1_9BACI|nr:MULTISPECIES: thioredoxin family protein [Bacillus]ASB89250.1 SPBc2 prophage-derived thioredoxin-like protein YosR [Bacillus sonorensis]ATH95401.1 thiol reductase thioredoxin [Bacillus glycinifermentans]MEC0338426.1 thioredoxin family protein [Bacillus sonorensis]MEC0425283.1 thioredoxin family protein [Bacillus sonorensis]MEC0460837.1 thioredoxin family protein [Bacillus sonorensis]